MAELKKFEFPTKLRKMLIVTLKNITRINETISNEIKITKGVKQRDTISPTLFNLILEAIIRKVRQSE